MKATNVYIRSKLGNFLSAIQFLTRIPVSTPLYTPDTLSRAVKFFPVVGLVVGFAAASLHRVLAPHLPRLISAFLTVTFLVLLTGCFHEDGLADTADGFGGGWNREQILVILKDSRIGSYGGAALIISLVGRILLVSSIPLGEVTQYLIAAHVLCRWTTLPLSYYLPAARPQKEGHASGQGERIAGLTSLGSLIAGSIFSFAVVGIVIQKRALVAIPVAILITLASGNYYKRRIGGVTGDCFGATNQVSEIAVYLIGVWAA